jgi:hypothetical protein
LPQQKQRTKSIDDNNDEWLKDLIENGECETMMEDAALVDPAELTVQPIFIFEIAYHCSAKKSNKL